MISPLPWRKATFSSGSGSCVEMSRDTEGQIFVRNSNRPAAGTLTFTMTELGDWLDGCAAGEIDDLT